MVRSDLGLARYWSALVREMTRRPESPASRLVSSSVSPSAKYWSAPGPRFLSGSTTSTLLPGTPGVAGAERIARTPRMPATAIASTVSDATSQRRRAECRGRGVASDTSSLAFKARAKAAADSNRSSGCRASARVRARSIASGTSARTDRTDGGGSVSRRAMMLRALGPVMGGVPATAS